MDKRNFQYADHTTAAALRNKIVIQCYSIMVVIIVIAYLIEVLKGSRSIGSFALIAIGCIATVVAEFITYLKKRDSKSVRYIMAIGFPVVYAYIMLSSDTCLTFCYILLILILSLAYSDIKITSYICGISILVNVIWVIRNALAGKLTGIGIAEVEIVVACIILASLFTVKTTKCIQKINADRFDGMETESKKVSELLNNTINLSKSIIDNVEQVSNEMTRLDASISLTKSSMEDVVAGVNETTDSVQTQQMKTEEIGKHIEDVAKITDIINENVGTAESLVSNGKDVMDSLIKQVENSDEVSKLVAGEMGTLRENANNMQNILSLINSVANKTGLLALNASIEAARAGEAGKGFAVVAGEISNLANQTKEATGNINNLIGSIETSLEQVVASVDKLLQSNEMQGEYVEKTAQNFEQIHVNTNSIYDQSKGLADMVSKLATANQTIVESIQNISAVSEEMTARANETLESSQTDAATVSKVVKIVNSLNENAESMRSSTEIK